ncbi:MAG TPA: sigma 54-interacting transcriptional regulator [Myxococcales bacterium LLY-WYZ-16_1]|nr:sigma 54-interacting transcriptional regulator [Myxococcales bacterium LLY-WYZ-16_1]
MPAILVETPEQERRVFALRRPVVSIGASDDNDLRIAGLEPTHAQLVQDQGRTTIVGMLRDMVVNGRREKRAVLKTGDQVRFGHLCLTYFEREEDAPRAQATETPAPPEASAADSQITRAYRRLRDFTARLSEDEPTGRLVEIILDAVLELTAADKGFLVLIEDGHPVVRAARRIDRKEVQLSLDQLSDSILQRVIETKEPLVVKDALASEEFKASESVINLKLFSVMCCPLLERQSLRGLLYVGHHRPGATFDDQSLEVMEIFAAQASLLLGQARRLEELQSEKTRLSEQLEADRMGRLVGSCESMQEVFRRVRRVANTDISVLVTGETGTGKELIARQIHDLSRRADGPFVVINCGAIPENLLESELFGHVRGAFTGAERTRDGRFQAANGGTLFLDEIGEMPLALQVKLLRAIQERVVVKVGDGEPEPVDIRIVAATNRNLEAEVRAGNFREDLYYRLDVVNVRLPPLRERDDDLLVLARYFLSRAVQRYQRPVKGFTNSAEMAIRKYAWPGNVRELENRIEKAVVLADGPSLTPGDLDIRAEDLEEVLTLADAKERFQARYIRMVLRRNGGNRTRTAKELGVDPRTIFRHLERLQEDPLPEDPAGADALSVEPERG